MARIAAKKRKTSSIRSLENSYEEIYLLAERLHKAICEQICSIIDAKGLTLGVPLESRIKSWASIQEKVERTGLSINEVRELNDLIGVRAILLFRDELDEFQSIVRDTFDIISEEDTAERLGEAQFGYQSRHLVVRLPREWLKIPSLEGLDGLRVEIQIRTVAQHIWAAASHKLQYKRERSVPLPVRRAIFRVSALLETVDLELLRVLEERASYLSESLKKDDADGQLNVDNLKEGLKAHFPEKNLGEHEPYDKLLQDLTYLGVETWSQFEKMIEKHLDETTDHEKKTVEARLENEDFAGTDNARLSQDVFFKHVGLARQVLRLEFGKKKVDAALQRSR